MNPRHHPPESHWMAYVAGQADASQRLMLESHLDLCKACAKRVAGLAEPGGRMLRELRREVPPPDLFARILDRLPAQPSAKDDLLPAAVRALLPPEADRAWKGVLKAGARFLELMTDEARNVRLYLVHLRAGATFPHHAHRGLEEVVILAGGAVDGDVTLEAGDWRAYPAGSAHDPGALPDEDCWLLTRVEDDVKLSGWRGLLQRL